MVPTPIGNLEDITLRALRILKECDFILAEDTRQTLKLLNHYSIDKSVYSYHQNNEHKILESTVQRIMASTTVALVTDAGTPAISDPGFLLVRECLKNNVDVECLPGATAFVPAIVNSGLPCERFIYEGFLPHKKGKETRIKKIAASDCTTVLYESPHRVVKTLESLAQFCGDERLCSVSRELTKHFEETFRGTLRQAVVHFQTNEPRGEFVLVVNASE